MSQRPHPAKKVTKSLSRHTKKLRTPAIILALSALLLLFSASLYASIRYYDRVLPGIRVAGVDVSGMSRDQVAEVVTKARDGHSDALPNLLSSTDYHIDFNPQENIQINIDKTVAKIMQLGRTVSWKNNIVARIAWARHPTDIPLEVSINQDWLDAYLQDIKNTLEEPVIPPTITKDPQTQELTITQEEPGLSVQEDILTARLLRSFQYVEPLDPTIPTKVVTLGITDQEIEDTRSRAQSLIGKTLELQYQSESGQDYSWTITDDELIALLGFKSPVDIELLREYITETASKINQPPQNAKFTFDATTSSVKEFAPALSGIELDTATTTTAIEAAIIDLAYDQEVNPITITVLKSAPEITLEDINDLGIKELIGRGDSTYYGSIASRVFNVGHAAGKVTGTLVPPGEEFSFNASVGDISQATGFKSAYIISNGRTELGDGGGVCQDSTTIFRAALDAGLPITERRSHSYRVGYYEQNAKAGLDATVYSPTTDFKFLNDTPAHILIQAYADAPTRTLVVEIYGTSDGRQSQITDHVVYDITPPLPEEFIDDPSKPNGYLEQIDWAAGGAKAKFDYTVTRDGETIYEKTFYSVYKPWAAKFIRGTG